jgi:integrase
VNRSWLDQADPKSITTTCPILWGKYSFFFSENQVWKREFIAWGERWQEHGLLFINNLGGPMDPCNQLRDFREMLNAAGLPILRFHDHRYSVANLMLNTGIPVIIVSRRLGHSRPSVTLDVYGHLIPSMQLKQRRRSKS